MYEGQFDIGVTMTIAKISATKRKYIYYEGKEEAAIIVIPYLTLSALLLKARQKM